jgi:hypothetical protein
VHQAAHILANHEQQTAEEVQVASRRLVEEMTWKRSAAGALQPAIDHFLKVTRSYAPGLFHCYDVPALPRTNNDLEHVFGATRYHERRATGRKAASPALVVRGSVRLVAALVTRQRAVGASELQPRKVAAWRELRKTLDYRHDARRAQRRFRSDPAAYLAALEEQLCKPTLPA